MVSIHKSYLLLLADGMNLRVELDAAADMEFEGDSDDGVDDASGGSGRK